MKHSPTPLFSCLLLVCLASIIPLQLFSQDRINVHSLVLLRPTGQTNMGIPLLEVMPQNDPQVKIIEDLSRQSFISEMIDLNVLVQADLLKRGLISEPEPLYLLSSGRMGGFPMHGFFLKKDGKILDKRNVSYVDLAKVETNYRQLGSITQIYPHELAHILFMQYSGIDPNNVEEYSSDIHYFSMVTNYLTAFNEGFAESFENISRHNEKNPSVIRGVETQARSLEHSLNARSRGFDRDFRWPLRIGFYRLTMVEWYQSLEDYKRYRWAMDAYGRYKALSFSSGDAEKMILYRNACVMPDTASRSNTSECHSKEGVINSFFTMLMESSARFYYPPDHPGTMSPLQNQLMKEFDVMTTCFKNIPPGSSYLRAFIRGYLGKYPAEKQIVSDAYQKATGLPLTEGEIPELWVLNQDHSHNVLVMAQFGGCVIPYYTMNLNTAGVPDLLTFGELSQSECVQFLKWRDSRGGLAGFEELASAPPDLQHISTILKKAKLDPVQFSKMDSEGGLSISGFLISLVLHILKVAFILIFAISVIQWLLFYRKRRDVPAALKLLVKNLFKVLMFLVVAVAVFLLPGPPLLVFSGFTFVIIAFNLISSRKNPGKRREILFSSLSLFLVIGYSLL
jgi:hypothetical protein